MRRSGERRRKRSGHIGDGSDTLKHRQTALAVILLLSSRLLPSKTSVTTVLDRVSQTGRSVSFIRLFKLGRISQPEIGMMTSCRAEEEDILALVIRLDRHQPRSIRRQAGCCNCVNEVITTSHSLFATTHVFIPSNDHRCSTRRKGRHSLYFSERCRRPGSQGRAGTGEDQGCWILSYGELERDLVSVLRCLKKTMR